MNSNPSEVYHYSATLATPFQLTGRTQSYLAILDEPTALQWQFGEAGTNYDRNGVDETTTSTRNCFQPAGASAIVRLVFLDTRTLGSVSNPRDSPWELRFCTS